MGRQQLFEEFLQCAGDWTTSALVVNARAFSAARRRGVYKYFSEQEQQTGNLLSSTRII